MQLLSAGHGAEFTHLGGRQRRGQWQIKRHNLYPKILIPGAWPTGLSAKCMLRGADVAVGPGDKKMFELR